LKVSGKRIFSAESELEYAPEVAHRLRRSVDRHRTPLVGKPSQIVETHDVVRVRMGKNHRIEVADVFAERLSPEIRSGVDNPGALWGANVDRRSQALIARVGRMANGAVATNRRNSLGRSGPEEGER